MLVNPRRTRILAKGKWNGGPVVYWMSRDQRVNDNWALLFALEMAAKKGVPLTVTFCLVPEFLGATSRQYRFMLQGLKEVESRLKLNNIPFYLLTGTLKKRYCGSSPSTKLALWSRTLILCI